MKTSGEDESSINSSDRGCDDIELGDDALNHDHTSSDQGISDEESEYLLPIEDSVDSMVELTNNLIDCEDFSADIVR
jgi:hypothetical protein